MGDVRQALVLATRDAHEALHEHARIAPLMRSDLTVDVYRDLLIDYFILYTNLEAQRAAASWWPALSLEPLVSALRWDLSDLGTPRPAFERVETGLELASDDAVLGALYVLHGASFGASVIGSAIARTLPHSPCRFFSRPQGLARRWRRLLASLETTGKAEPKRQAIIAGADATFLHFGTFLSNARSLPPLSTS